MTPDWYWSGIGLALDRHWIDIRMGWIGTGLAPNRDALASAWHQIAIRLALDRHYIGTGLGTGLGTEWHRIGP